MTPRKSYVVPLAGRGSLVLGERTLVMGIINVTPDSFADGGLRFDADRAVADGLQMIADGADILDVGGESTRPGANPLPEDEELRRVLPVIERLAREAQIPISVDTYKATVARQALDRGAAMVNDISGLAYEPALADAVAASGAGLVLMHNRGTSRAMYREASYQDVAGEILLELETAMARAATRGIRREQIIVDPGLGFAKQADHSWTVLAELDRLAALDRPILIGPSRKSFLKAAIGDRPAAEREWATAAATAAGILGGAHIVRVHGVREMVDVARAADRVRARHAWMRPY